jgi:hypothetical protein
LYLLIAKNTRSPEYMSRLIEGLRGRREPQSPAPAPATRDASHEVP